MCLVCALCWSDHFPYRERCRWAHCIPTCTSVCVSPTSHACSMVRKDLVLGSEQEEDSDHRQVFERFSSCASKEARRSSSRGHLLVAWFAEPSKDGLVKTLQIRSFSTAFLEHPGDCCQMTSRENPEPGEQPLRFDVRPVRNDLPHPINNEPAKPRRVYIRNSVELARCGYTLGCIGCCIIRSSAGREVTQAMSSDADLSARGREAHERMLRSVSDAEPNHEKR